MSSRAEITAKFAKAYVKASKADKGQILDQVVEVTGWSRDNARRRLTAAARPPGAGRQVAKRPRRQRKPKYSYDALKVLQKVWAASGGQCGRYLAASMAVQLACTGTPRRTGARSGPLQPRGACRTVGDEQRDDRPLPARRPRPATRSRGNRPPSPPRCCGPRSRSARQPTRLRHRRGSSKATPSRTAGRPSKVSSPAP